MSHIHIFIYLGFATSIVLLFAFINIIIVVIKEAIQSFQHKYAYKHRFNKPPTAKCYCIDCKKWDKKTGRCYRFDNGLRTADCWFCWEADPKEKE